jgi:hypothetical protein
MGRHLLSGLPEEATSILIKAHTGHSAADARQLHRHGWLSR